MSGKLEVTVRLWSRASTRSCSQASTSSSTLAFQPIDVGEAVADLFGQLMATDDPHGTGTFPKGASRNVR
jgi:hypothetical protein